MIANPYVRFYQVCREYSRARKELDPIAALFRECLREAADAMGQSRIAKHVGVSPAYLNDILHNRREISANFVDRVKKASVLEMSVKA